MDRSLYENLSLAIVNVDSAFHADDRHLYGILNFFNDHPPTHFHGGYGEFERTFDNPEYLI